MASALAHLELLLLCLLTLSVALIPELPIRRGWAAAAALLVAVQTTALRHMGEAPYVPAEARGGRLLTTTAEVVAVVVVPALTAVLLVILAVPLARANARTRRRLRAAFGRRAGLMG